MERTGKLMWVIFWCLVLLALTYYFNGQINEKTNPNQQVKSLSDGEKTSVILKQNNRGHYVANGTINGHQVTFLLDTGATIISIPSHIANKLQLQQGRPYFVSTANGNIEVFATRLSSLSIGDLLFSNLDAHINPGIDDDIILLGMNALKHLEMRQINNTLTLTIPHYE